MVVLLTTVFVATACGKDQAIIAGPAGADPTIVSTTGGTTTTVAPTTTTTVDPAAIQGFLNAWNQAELDAATTTTTAPQPSVTQPKPAPKPAAPKPTTAPAPQGGGSAPNAFLACVRQRESGNNYQAVNPSSGAGGAYQFMVSTWRAMGGYGLPQNADPATQDAMALKLYNQAGRSPWAGGQYAC